MVSNHLLVECSVRPDEHADLKSVLHEVAASVDESPNVEVACRVEARIVCENIALFTDGEHSEDGEDHAANGVDGRHAVGTILTLPNLVQFHVAFVTVVKE